MIADATHDPSLAGSRMNIPEQVLAQILEIAIEAFDDRAKALRWLQRPNIQTGNKPPIEVAGTKEGFDVVETATADPVRGYRVDARRANLLF